MSKFLPLFPTTEATSCCSRGRSHFQPEPPMCHGEAEQRRKELSIILTHASPGPDLPQGCACLCYCSLLPQLCSWQQLLCEQSSSNSNRNHCFFQGRRIHWNYGNGEKQTKGTARFVLFYFGLRRTSLVKVKRKMQNLLFSHKATTAPSWSVPMTAKC